MRRAIAFTIALSLSVPSVASAEPNTPAETTSPSRSRVPEVVGAVLAASGGLVFMYGAGRWLIGAIASDDAHPFDLVGGHCQDGDDQERHACESRRSAEDESQKTGSERNRHAGAVAMGIGTAIAVTGTVILLLASLDPPKPEKQRASTRILPLDTPVHYVPPPGSGGTTVIVPAIGGTW